MTAQELIEILTDLDPETEIYVQHTSGDYWKTQLASPVEDGDLGKITHSSYHNQNKVVEDEGDYDDDTEVEEAQGEVYLLKIGQRY